MTVTPTDKGSIKVDQNFGSNHHPRFFYNRTAYSSQPGATGPAGLPEPLWNGQITIYNAADYRLSYDWTISPRLLNHLSIGGNNFTRTVTLPMSVAPGRQGRIKNAVDCTINFPNVSFSDFTSWGGAADNGTEQPMWSIKDDVSFVREAHTFKFGYDFESQRANGFGEQNIAGQATFSFLETAVPGVTAGTSGSSFASFLLGDADSGATETIRYCAAYRYHGMYAQDDWRITKRLILNIGLRYEFTLPPVSQGDQYSDSLRISRTRRLIITPGRFDLPGPGRDERASVV